MGCGKPNDKDNSPVPLKQSGERLLSGTDNEASASDQTSHVNNNSVSAFMPLPFSYVPSSQWENAQGLHQSYTQNPRIGSVMPVLMRPGTSQDAHSEHSFIDLRGNLRNQDIRLGGLNHPQVSMNFVPNPSTTPGSYYVNAHVGEGKAIDVNQSRITRGSLNPGCNPSMTPSTRETLVNDDARVSAPYPGNIDGSFLTLGIGGNVESRTKHKFSSREIASHLEESFNFPVAQTATSFPTPGHNLIGSSSFQNSPVMFPGSMYGSLGTFSSYAFQSSHMPEAFKQYDFFESGGRNLGIANKSPGMCPVNVPYNHSQGDPASALLPFSNHNTSTFHPGMSQFTNLTSESSKLMGTAFQPNLAQPQNYYARNVRDATPSFGSNSIGVTANPVTQDYLGKLIPAVQGSITQAIGGGPSMGVQPYGHISSTLGVNSTAHLGSTTFPGKTLPQMAESIATKDTTVGPFPRRLGVQPDDGPQSINQGMNPRVMGAQTRSGMNQSQPVELTRSLHGSQSGIGNPRESSHQFNIRAPLISSGPALLNVKADQPLQISNAIGQPSLKREAVDPPPVASWGRRRKLWHQPTPVTSIYQRSPVPSGTPHIRWQGFDKPQLVGHRCLLCNRDLSFAPEGPVYQPSMPPAVAVLPCGHTFHDHCLGRMTPEDQTKDPPCIPCAIGEAN